MKTYQPADARQRGSERAFTLAEIVIALGLSMIMFSVIIVGFVQSAQHADYAAENLAAQSFAQQGVEQARAAIWDPLAPSPIDYCNSSYFSNAVTTLDVPVTGNNYQYATDTWTITTISSGSLYPMKMIKVVCTWTFYQPGLGAKAYTPCSNTVAVLRAPDQ